MKAKKSSNSSDMMDITAAWARAKKRWERMSMEEKNQTFVDAGIFTKKGNPTKPYRGVFVKAKA
jgi:hypothetical protein